MTRHAELRGAGREGAHGVLVHAREYAVALGKAHHPRANGFDDTGEFVAHDDRERIVADDLQRPGARLEIDGIKVGDVDADQEFTSPGDGCGTSARAVCSGPP